jgi:hypothetical protein
LCGAVVNLQIFLTDPEYKPENKKERRLRSEANKRFTMQNGILYRYSDDTKPEHFGVEQLQVITEDQAFDTITKAHEELSHAGHKKTFHLISENYYGITRDEVIFVTNLCDHCIKTKAKTTKAPLRPIKVNNLFERVQIDLMDFTDRPDGEYKYILHIVDHFSKYSCAFPLKNKYAEDVANAMAVYIAMFGPPLIVHCDNGTEFKGANIILLRQHGIRIINGRPRHPQSQGLVEKANGTFKDKLRKWSLSSGSVSWTRAIPEICMSMNKQRHSTTKVSPYEIVFKQKMRRKWISFAERRTAEPVDETEVDDIEQELPGTYLPLFSLFL